MEEEEGFPPNTKEDGKEEVDEEEGSPPSGEVGRLAAAAAAAVFPFLPPPAAGGFRFRGAAPSFLLLVLLVLPTLPGPLAAALHVCHSSLCRQSSAPSRARPCRALRKCGESARPEHWSRHTTGATRERTLPGTRLHLREHKRARCQPRPPAAPSRQTPPNSRRARPAASSCAWPAARLVARACCAGVRLE